MSNGNGWMPLYIGDYLGDTMELDGAQHGGYLLLLMYYWRNGPLPLDDAKLAQIARFELRVWKRDIWPAIKGFFTEHDGRLHQKRADLELAKAAECHERALEKRQADNYRLKAWRAKQGQDGSHPPMRPNGQDPPEAKRETRFTGVSPPVSERVAKRAGNADETRLTCTETGTETVRVKDQEPLPSSLKNLGSTREEAPQNALDAVLAEAGVQQPEPGNVGAEIVAMHVRRTAKACEMHLPYGTVRSRSDQIDAALGKLPPVVEGADYRWQPADPVRTVAEQYAELTGMPLTEAMAKFGESAAA